MKIKKTVPIFSVLILFVFAFFILDCAFSMSIGTRHFVNSIINPKDLYKPIVLDRFLFYEKNFSKKYSLNPIYLDIYEIGFLIDQGGIESTYKFKGKLKIEFFWKDNLLFDSIITSWDSALYVKNDMLHYKQISLYKFNIPLQEKYTKDISVKLTVLEPDKELKKFNNLVTLYIAVSTSP